MKPKSTRRATFPRIVTTMLVASALSATAAHAATFQYRHPVVGLVASPTSQAEQVVTEILMALTGGPALPAGEVNLPYNYDLKQLLSVSGDPAYNSSNVSWELTSGALPAGLSLGSDGVISGTPTTKNVAGSSFQVLATYKTKSGQQAYTIMVNGEVLRATLISAGANHTCAVTLAGGVKCWGSNGAGQLGDGTRTSKAVPVQVSGLTAGVVSVSAGYSHSCAVLDSGVAKCWGHGEMGQLGPLSTVYQTTPVVVSNTLNFRSIAAGEYYSCGVTVAGAVYCWGYNRNGTLGDGTTYTSYAPKQVLGVTATSVSATAHTCVVTTDGGAKCWGLNNSGQVGVSIPAYGYITSPVQVTGLSAGVTAIAAGGYHTCAVVSGAAKCWGANGAGQLGNGTTNSSITPVAVSALSSSVAQVTAGNSGSYHSCALTNSGAVMCWGGNSQGQLGDGTATGKGVPVSVIGSGALAVTGGSSHTCALTAQGSKCWGSDDAGQLGDDSALVRQLTPTSVAP